MFTIPASGDGTIAIVRPSAVTGTINNAGNAWDGNEATYADITEQVGSAVSGTPDNISVVFHTFGSRAKNTFANCRLFIKHSCRVTTSTFDANYMVSAAIRYEYSVDGGTTWILLQDIIPSIEYTDGFGNKKEIAVEYPAQHYTANAPYDQFFAPNYIDVSILSISKNIPSSAFSTNVSDLRIRTTASTLTMLALKQDSAAYYRIHEIYGVLT